MTKAEVGGESGYVKKEESEDFKVEGADESVSCRREPAACEQRKGCSSVIEETSSYLNELQFATSKTLLK